MSKAGHSGAELNQLFLDGESADQELFAEMRSNIQLISGDHYAKKGNKFANRIRENKDIPQEQKIRLTKNHIRKIVLTYRNSITNYAPGVKAAPKDKSSLQNQKTAEISNSVWEDAKSKLNLNKKINQFAHDFVGIGEVAAKIFFDPMAGKYLGEEAAIDPETGQVQMDEMGKPISSGVPRFSGDMAAERLFGFNIIRPAGCKVMDEAEWLCNRKMVKVDDLRALIDNSTTLDDEEKEELKKKVVETADQTYMILDGNTGSYKNVKDQTMMKEFFFRRCAKYPNGYFYLMTGEIILFEGELPFGIFPIVMEGFDEIQTSPRCRAIVKPLRPYQIEINRCASKIAEHQISLGDDKILVQNGTKLTPGVALPGVRSLQYSGMAPIVMSGRSGEQYLAYMNSQISEMYAVAMVEEQKEEKAGNFDAYAALFKSMKDKKKFSLYTDGFESFLKKFFKTYMETFQKYANENHLIPAIGKSEYINIDEFKKVDELSYNIVLEAQSDDSETKLGKQIGLNHFIQYVGPQLAKDDLGKILRLMPYANDEEILDDLTMNYDQAVNIILALDRGKPFVPKQYGDPAYLIKKLTNRTIKADFEMLGPQIKQNYDEAIGMLQQQKTDEEIKIKQAQSEFIPTSGYLVACDFYVPDGKNPEKLPKRVRIPSEALQWLLNQLTSQGSDQETLAGLGTGALSEMSTMLMNKLHQAGGGGMSPQPQLMPQMGQTNPGGQLNGHN